MSTAHTWTTLDPTGLNAWIGARLSGAPPPLYRLASVAPTPAAVQQFPSANVTRRTDSGVAELIVPGRFGPLPAAVPPWSTPVFPALAAVIERAVAFAAEEDPGRRFSERERPDPLAPYWEYRSLIPPYPAAEPIPVIGPGGRIAIHNAPRGSEPGIEVDIVIRRRLAPLLPSIWRHADDIVAAVRDEIGSAASPVTIHAAFGYFELSKYERQDVLRPAFVFVLASEAAVSPLAPWQYTIVEPATESPGLLPGEGLGSWATQ